MSNPSHPAHNETTLRLATATSRPPAADNAPNQLVGEISQSPHAGTLSVDQINQSASAFAGDVMQALPSDATAATSSTVPPTLA